MKTTTGVNYNRKIPITVGIETRIEIEKKDEYRGRVQGSKHLIGPSDLPSNWLNTQQTKFS